MAGLWSDESPGLGFRGLEAGLGTMAVFAVLGGRFVEEHLLAVEVSEQLVAVGAADVLVRAGEGELGAFVVIEQRGLPLGGVVTIRAGSRSLGLRELAPVNVGMAVLALGGSFGEVGIDELRAHIRRLVAVDAGDSAMRAGERKPGSLVIETCQIFPSLGGVAGLAPDCGAVAA